MGIRVLIPRNLNEALELLKDNNGEILPISGGTDVMVDLHHGRISPKALLDLSNIEEYREINMNDEVLEIGGLVTHKELADSPILNGQFTALKMAAKVVGGPQIRNVGTIGGNIQSGSPAADTSPPLLALNSSITLTRHEGTREVLLSDFFIGPKKTILKPNELITKVTTEVNSSVKSIFLKVGKRNSLAISIVNLAVALELDEKGRCRYIGIALGSVAPTPIRAYNTEKLLLNKEIDSNIIEEAKDILEEDISPIDDVRADAEYRMLVAKNLLARALNELTKDGRGY